MSSTLSFPRTETRRADGSSSCLSFSLSYRPDNRRDSSRTRFLRPFHPSGCSNAPRSAGANAGGGRELVWEVTGRDAFFSFCYFCFDESHDYQFVINWSPGISKAMQDGGTRVLGRGEPRLRVARSLSLLPPQPPRPPTSSSYFSKHDCELPLLLLAYDQS